MSAPANINLINDEATLEAINGQPSAATLAKKVTVLDAHARGFIERSPFAVLCTSSDTGVDTSPRGDPAGFVKCVDDTTLLLPERPGNRIADSLRNLIANPEMALLFMIPGWDETLRVNGRGYITDHAPYLAQLEHKGKAPKLAIVVDVAELFFHCPKAYIRSDLWGDSQRIDRAELPSLGRMILEQVTGAPPAPEVQAQIDAALVADTKDNLY